MSNDKTASPLKPVPALFADAPGIKIRHIRFNTKGMIIASPKEAHEQVVARETDATISGYDIWYVIERRAFRFDRYDNGQLRVVKWVPEAIVVVYEQWDQPSSAA